MRRQVFLASPITLIALLQVVAHGWRHERLAQNAEEIQPLGKELYERVAKMTEYLDTLRTRLDGTVRAFNDVVGSYETRVLVTARKFKELGATSGTEIEPLQSARHGATHAAERQSARPARRGHRRPRWSTRSAERQRA